MRMALWELLFMLVILKLPVVYLCLVVWWAVKAEPRPLEGATRPVLSEPAPGPGRFGPLGRNRPRPGPHGSPVRSYARRAGPLTRKLVRR